VRRVTLASSAAAAALGAFAAVALAHDAHSWRSAIARGDARFQRAPASMRWHAHTWLPGDPAARLLPVGGQVALRRAVQAFVTAERTGLGFDNGEQRARVRSAATVALSKVAAARAATASSQANDLLGVLLSSAGQTAAGETGDEQALGVFQAAVRADPANGDAKYNLELALRRAQPTGVRHGPGNGTGPSEAGRRGAGSGTPGRGY
jgi:hypothetical protein